MTSANLTSVLKGSVENGRRIGHGLVRAYGAGGRRMLHVADRGFTKVLANPPIALTEPLRAQVKATGKQVVQWASGGVKVTSTTAIKAIDTVCDGSEVLLGGIHARVLRIDNVYASRAVDWLADAGRPAAEFGFEFTDRLAHASARLATVAAGRKPRVSAPRRRTRHAKKAQH